ncbi:MAG: hypothetical protein QM784_28600 [Polyangiaceae bacterium]
MPPDGRSRLDLVFPPDLEGSLLALGKNRDNCLVNRALSPIRCFGTFEFARADGSRPWQVSGVCRFWVLATAVTLGCVPTARSRPPAETSFNAPPPPGPNRTATGLLASQPGVTHASSPPEPGPDERIVDGAFRWAGTEYRYIPAHREKRDANYVWKREPSRSSTAPSR